MQFDDRAFRKALGCFATGVAVVTTLDAQGAPVGVTVNSFTSVSLKPPLVSVCLQKGTRSLEAFRRRGYAVNVLSESQREASIAFAGQGEDKWTTIQRIDGVDGLPLIGGALAHVQCGVYSVVEGGDHVIIVGEVKAVSARRRARPLLYYRGDYAALAENAR